MQDDKKEKPKDEKKKKNKYIVKDGDGNIMDVEVPESWIKILEAMNKEEMKVEKLQVVKPFYSKNLLELQRRAEPTGHISVIILDLIILPACLRTHLKKKHLYVL